MVSIVSPGFIALNFCFHTVVVFFCRVFFILRHLHLIWCSVDCCAFVFPPLLQRLLFSVYCIVLLFRHFWFSCAIPFAFINGGVLHSISSLLFLFFFSVIVNGCCDFSYLFSVEFKPYTISPHCFPCVFCWF